MENKMNAGWIGILKPEDDMWKCVKSLSEIGYRGFEGGEWLLEGNPEDNMKRLQDMDLQVLTVTADLDEFHKNNFKDTIKKAKDLKAERATIWFCNVNMSFFGKEPEYDKFMKDIEVMEKAAKVLKAEGITLCYHNHFQDFLVNFNSIKSFDLILANTEVLQFELDLGWVVNGKENPYTLMERIAPRLSLIHVKDYLDGEKRVGFRGNNPIFTSTGNGVLHLEELLSTASRLGMKWVVVEQDELRNLSPMESLWASYLNMKETGYVI